MGAKKKPADKDLNIDLKAGFGFDPDWTLEQAMAAGSEGPLSPFWRWQRWQQLENEYKKRFEAGDKDAVFTALHSCACSNLPMPDWLAGAYATGFHKWVNYRAKSLDEAFDVEIPKGKHLNALRKNRKLRVAVPLAVDKARNEGNAIQQGLFEKIGKEFGISGSSAKNLYYKYRNTFLKKS